MGDIFISHVEEDAGIAIGIAQGLEAAGHSTWYYERDSLPGISYLLQTAQAIEMSRAVVLVISPHSLGSHQVTKEVIRAHETGKTFIPVLSSITHLEFGNRQPEWREAVGSATSITVPRGGVAGILPRILDGIRALGIPPSSTSPGSPAVPSRIIATSPKPLLEIGRFALSPRVAIAVGVFVVAASVTGTVSFIAGGQSPKETSGVKTSTVSRRPSPTSTVSSLPTVSPPAEAKPPAVGKVGDTLSLAGQFASRKVEVTLHQVVDPAKTNKDVYIDDADRLVAFKLTIKNVGTELYDDEPSQLAEVIDAAGRQYEADPFDTIDPGFGQLRIGPGVSIEGYITFEIPKTLRLTTFMFSAETFEAETGKWTIG